MIRPLRLNASTVVVAELESIEASRFNEELRTLILRQELIVGYEKNAAGCSVSCECRHDFPQKSKQGCNNCEKCQLAGGLESSLERLASASEEVRLSQGQTLLRVGTMETHAFLVLEGTLRLLGKDPVLNDLFTVGRVEPGELVGVIDLLRQAPCEAAIARQTCLLLSLPLELILDLVQEDSGLLQSLQSLQSPCEGVAVLSSVLKRLNPPPVDTQEWFREQLEASKADDNTAETKQKLLSSVLPRSEESVGCVLTRNGEFELSEMSNLPLRFWTWTPACATTSSNNAKTAPAPTQALQLAQLRRNNPYLSSPGHQPRT